MRFRPCIDLHDGRVKQIVGSTYRDGNEGSVVTNFIAQKPSSWFASLYCRDNLTGGHIIMLGPGNECEALAALRVFPGGFQVGGGITPESAPQFLEQGASHVIMTSYVFSGGTVHWDNLENAVSSIGKERLVLDLSCKKRDGRYYAVSDRWQRFTDCEIGEKTLIKLGVACDEFLVHAADVEGKQAGIDSELVRLLAGSSPLPVTYAGGVRSLDDLDLIRRIGNNRVDVTVGSALDIFGGPLKYTDIIQWRHRQQTGA